MKIANLLAQYLYHNHRLDLPGIGTFTLDPSSVNTSENSKSSTMLEGVSFKCNPSLGDSPDLIEFISSKTGKMKALANADLGSHLQLAQQFLNISKPFTFEGIGTLVMKKPGEIEFQPAALPADKLKENKARDNSPATSEAAAKYESFLDSAPKSFSLKNSITTLLVLAGIGLAVWGGYMISKRSRGNVNSEKEATQAVLPAPDTAHSKDSVITPAPPPVPKDYKYVLEVSKKQRAFKRYSQLKTNLWDVHMETNDSINFKLFILLPSSRTDTTHIVDSLTNWLGRKVYIDHQN